MELLKTNHCCWCFDLRTGGLIIGYLLGFSSIFGIFGAFVNGPEYILPNLAGVALSGCWIYGIENKKSSWMLLFLVLRIIVLCFIVLALVIVISFLFFITMQGKNADRSRRKEFDYFLFAAYLLFPIAALEWHYTSVVYSLFKNIKHDEEQNLCDPSVPLNTPPPQYYPVLKV